MGVDDAAGIFSQTISGGITSQLATTRRALTRSSGSSGTSAGRLTDPRWRRQQQLMILRPRCQYRVQAAAAERIVRQVWLV